MCEYCEGSKTLLISSLEGQFNSAVLIERGILILHLHNNCNESAVEIEITHCPICGKKLTQQEVEP